MVSSTFALKAVASILSVISIADAHMIMKTPIPYGRGVINNSPLANDGSDFPCKNIFEMTDKVNDINYLVPGTANTLSFTGSAVHGGGSCQVSLTTDLAPNKQSTWMVIKSIEGGCPANTAGNLPADPNGNGASTFQYTVPVGFPEGQYTIAWTWFNKIGNREMYMNCGRAVVKSSKKRYAAAEPKALEHRAANYPDIFKANLAIFGQCTVPEGINVAFPNPGSDVTTVAAAQAPNGCGAGKSSPAPTGGSGSGSGSGSSASSQIASVTNTATNAANTPTAGRPTNGFATGGAQGGSKTSGTPGVFVPAASQTSVPDASSAPEDPSQPTATASVTVAPVPAQPSATPASNGSSPPASGPSSAGSACTSEGAWLCASDGKSFQRCASGMWSAPMQVAAGTSCTPGQGMDLNMQVVGSSGSGKRDLRLHEHLAAHRRGLRFSS